MSKKNKYNEEDILVLLEKILPSSAYLKRETTWKKEIQKFQKDISTPQQGGWEKNWKWIEVRILAEKNKHENMGNNEWAKIAAIKIKSFISAQIQQAQAEGYEEGTKGLPSKGVEEYEREIRQETLKEVLDKIDKVYKQEKGIHHWLDLREEIKLGIKL